MHARKPIVVTLGWLTVALATFPGCGDSGGGGGGGSTPVSSGLPSSKPVGGLSATELTQFCKAVDAAFNDPAVNDGICKFAAALGAAVAAGVLPTISDADLQKACTEAYQECKKPDTSPMSECKPASGSCTATVGEFEKCLSDMKAGFVKLGATVPACSMLTKASLMQMEMSSQGEDPISQPDSCKVVEQKCPGMVPEPNLPD
jgi:hypothetical protein